MLTTFYHQIWLNNLCVDVFSIKMSVLLSNAVIALIEEN